MIKQTCRLLISALLCLMVCAQAWASIHADHPYHFLITKQVFKTTEIYQIKSREQDTYPGTVKKSMFRVRTNYDLSDKNGWSATGIVRLFSLGSVYPWAKDVDIYDTRGVQIGMIDGSFVTLESARFDIYEYDEAGNHNLIGVAYASGDFNQFTIHPDNQDPRTIAELTRVNHESGWSVSVHNPELIDDRIIRIFSGFVIDHQDKFLTATPTEAE